MRFALLPLTLLALPLAACSVTKTVTAPPSGGEETASEKDGDKDDKTEELEHKLEIARAKHEIAVLEAAAFDAKHEVRIRHAQAELAMAEAKLATFREVDRPHRVASEELNLQGARDRAQEAQDELAQIEIMYAEQDLDDMTREFVIQRGRRTAERARKRLELQEGDLQALKQRELPQEEEKLKLAVDKAATGLKNAEREGEIGRRQKSIAVKEAENGVAKLERELEEAQAKDQE